MPWKTRLAPTPSGFLHEGNALNFLLIQAVQKKLKARVFLRIDDLDQERVREEYIEDIFQTLVWLEIEPDEGPSSVEEFKKHYSQLDRFESYEKAWLQLKAMDQIFPCTCSRKSIGSTAYPGYCKTKAADLKRAHCWRFRGEGVCELGDFIVWTKKNQAAYQLASLVDDHKFDVNLIVRGDDLFQSTQAQLCLKQYLYPDQKTWVYHHGLIKDGVDKLSKSQLHHQAIPLRERYSNLEQLKARIDYDHHLKMLDDFISRHQLAQV